jgi:hypothetical protein
MMSENICIYANTQSEGYDYYPAYINYSKRGGGKMILTVRGTNQEQGQEIELPLNQFWALVAAVGSFHLPADIEFVPSIFVDELSKKASELEAVNKALTEKLAESAEAFALVKKLHLKAMSECVDSRAIIKALNLQVTQLVDALEGLRHAEPEAMALVLSHEGHIESLNLKLKTLEVNAQLEIDRLNAQVLQRDEKIESLNLRVARLVDACNQYENNVKPWSVVATALSAEGDSQWLREKQAEAVKKYQLNLVQQFQEHDSDEFFITTVIDEILK